MRYRVVVTDRELPHLIMEHVVEADDEHEARRGIERRLPIGKQYIARVEALDA